MAFGLISPESYCKCALLKSTEFPRKYLNIEGPQDAEVMLLLKYRYPDKYLDHIDYTFNKHNYGFDKIKVAYALGCVPGDYKDPRNYRVYLTCKKHNILNMVRRSKPKVILVDGFALRTITEGANLSAKSFYNMRRLTGTKSLPTGFYSPEFNAWILPLPDCYQWIGMTKRQPYDHVLDNYHHFFVKKQLSKIKKYLKKEPEFEDYTSHYLEDPNQWLKDNMGVKEFAFDIETTHLTYHKGEPFSMQVTVDSKNGYYMDWDKIDKPLLNEFFKGKYVICANGKFDIRYIINHGVPDAHYEFDVNYAGHILYSGRSNGLKEATYYYTNFGGYDNELDQFKRQYAIDNYKNIPKEVMVQYACADTVMTFRLRSVLEKLMMPEQKEYFFNTYMPMAMLLVRSETRGILIDRKELIDYRLDLEKDIAKVEQEILRCLRRPIRLYNELVMHDLQVRIDETPDGFDAKKRGSIHVSSLTSNENVKRIFRDVLRAQIKYYTAERVEGKESVADNALQYWRTYGKDIQGRESWVIKRVAELMMEHREKTKLVTGFLSEGVKKSHIRSIIEDAPMSFNSAQDPYQEADPAMLKKRETTILMNVENQGDNGYILHPTFNMQGTLIWRLASSSPNVQNLPIKANPRFRKIFRARPGYYLAECDYSGFHLRIMAMLSGDKGLREAFTSDSSEDRDLHSKTAAAIFTKYSLSEFIDRMNNSTVEEKAQLKEYRGNAKIINFGFLYGRAAISFSKADLQGPYGWKPEQASAYAKEKGLSLGNNDMQLVSKGEITEAEAYYNSCAEHIREEFFKTYPGVKSFIEEIQDFAKSNLYVKSLFDCRIYLPELGCPGDEGEESRRAGTLNETVNYPVISTEAQIMHKAMVRLENHFRKSKIDVHILNQVHDSVLIEFPKSEVNSSLGQDIRSIMVEDCPEYKGIRLDAEAEYAPYWGGNPEKKHPDAKKLWFE